MKRCLIRTDELSLADIMLNSEYDGTNKQTNLMPFLGTVKSFLSENGIIRTFKA